MFSWMSAQMEAWVPESIEGVHERSQAKMLTSLMVCTTFVLALLTFVETQNGSIWYGFSVRVLSLFLMMSGIAVLKLAENLKAGGVFYIIGISLELFSVLAIPEGPILFYFYWWPFLGFVVYLILGRRAGLMSTIFLTLIFLGGYLMSIYAYEPTNYKLDSIFNIYYTENFVRVVALFSVTLLVRFRNTQKHPREWMFLGVAIVLQGLCLYGASLSHGVLSPAFHLGLFIPLLFCHQLRMGTHVLLLICQVAMLFVVKSWGWLDFDYLVGGVYGYEYMVGMAYSYVLISSYLMWKSLPDDS